MNLPVWWLVARTYEQADRIMKLEERQSTGQLSWTGDDESLESI